MIKPSTTMTEAIGLLKPSLLFKAEVAITSAIIETHKTSIKDKTASNAALLRQINALKNQIENDGKGEAATEQEVILKSKISETNKALSYLLKITDTTNLRDLIVYVEKTLPSNS